jgi:hypothetical protein
MRQQRVQQQEQMRQQRVREQQRVQVQQLQPVREQQQELLLSYRKQPEQRQRSRLPKRETCSFLKYQSELTKQFPEIVEVANHPDFNKKHSTSLC